jgi:hypothetical protein
MFLNSRATCRPAVSNKHTDGLQTAAVQTAHNSETHALHKVVPPLAVDHSRFAAHP